MSSDAPADLVARPSRGADKPRLAANLSNEQRQGAMLEGFGYDPHQVSAVLGVGRQTILRWSREVPGYKDAIAIFAERNSVAMEPLVARVKTTLVEAAIEAIASLKEALNAETLDGQPRWPVRNEAAALLLSHLKIVVADQGTVAGSGGSDDSGGSSPKSVEIIFNAPAAPAAPARVEVREHEDIPDAQVIEDAEVVSPGERDHPEVPYAEAD